MSKFREFVYIGNLDTQITEEEYAEFYLQFQKSILASLKKRELLTSLQYNHCIEELESQYKNENKR